MARARPLPDVDVDEWATIAADELVTGEAVALDLRPAGFALRAGGCIIDFFAYVVLDIVVLLGIFALADRLDLEDAVVQALVVASLVVCLVVVPASVELLSHGKSLGRLAVGARIVRADGGAIGMRHASIRALIGVLEIFLTLGGLAALTGLLTTRTRRLGDLVAGTYSQYERVGRALPPVFDVPDVLRGWAQLADVARLPDGLARRIAQFLTRAAYYDPARRFFLARELARETAAFVSPVPEVEPELFLAAVAVLRRQREAAALALDAQRLAVLQPALRGLPHEFPDRG